MDETSHKRLPRDPEAALWKNLPRNVTGMLLFEFTWGFGLPFGLYVSMVPAYLTDLGTTKSLMGFVQSFWTILIPLQLLAGHFFSSRGRVRADACRVRAARTESRAVAGRRSDGPAD